MSLSPDEARAIASRVTAVEARTGAEVVVALAERTDRYPEVRWKAFALAVALAALIVVLRDLGAPAWHAGVLVPVVAILAAGIANALAAQFLPAYGRLYVRRNRAEAEARQYAESLFLSRQLFATAHRRTVLIVAAAFERTVVVHADTALAARVSEADWQPVVAALVAGLRRGERAAAVLQGLDALEALLAAKGFAGDGTASNALADAPIEEPGP